MYCGKYDCVWPDSEPVGHRQLSVATWKSQGLKKDGTESWKDPISGVILDEVTALKWLKGRAGYDGGGFKSGFVLMNKDGWINYTTFRSSAFHCMQSAQEFYGTTWDVLEGNWDVVPVKMEITGPAVTDLSMNPD